jgi:hypothetical protein
MIDESVQIDGGRLFLSGAVEDWKPVHTRRITIVIDVEGGVDHGVQTMADEYLYVNLPIRDGGMPNLERQHAVAQLGARLAARKQRVLRTPGPGKFRGEIVLPTGLSSRTSLYQSSGDEQTRAS